MAHKVAVKSGRDREPPVATASNSERQKGAASTVHEVGEVYVYIPPELSAAGVELKILGSVRVINKVWQLAICMVYSSMHDVFISAL